MELRNKIESLTTMIKSSVYNEANHKGSGKRPQGKNQNKGDLNKRNKSNPGPPMKGKGPGTVGVGSQLERMPDTGKHKLKGTEQSHFSSELVSPRPQSKPQNQTVDPRTPLREGNLYHNPDPLFRLIGEANESNIILDGNKAKPLIDSGAQISPISKSFTQILN